MSANRTIIVTGATGRQGGAVVRALIDSNFEILALTRDSTSPSAQKLASLSSSIKLLQGDQDNAPAIFETANKIASGPVWGVFSVQAKPPNKDTTIEDRQAKGLIDASLSAGVEFFVYSSVDRGGAKSSTDATPIPHWATKHYVEQYLCEKAAGTNMRYTVLRPTAFMEGITNDFQGKAMASMWDVAMKGKPLQLVATKDIGWFAAAAFTHPGEFAGRYISLAGSSLTFDEANAIFNKRLGTDMPRIPGFVARITLHIINELDVMFKWIRKQDDGAHIDELKKMHPRLMDFGTWLETESPFRSQGL
ncbi:nucleoside-diphosphate-sugar epimerase family protein [Amniculicola lignicola CBS 123094]|uniref:Nucleoside-diphosphate-sugar epimerase family protein n=1 Tax=Amniculicola lignicola CBS 123094 TaxID=1392246 RepID=A0A6A5WX43_9PLEO|nr:nucleoside-diphosphate-sugar epimerase family protein [Amniculicola lignicola CBS 123094]